MNEKKNKPDAAALRDAKRGHKARIGYARIVLVCLLGALLAVPAFAEGGASGPLDTINNLSDLGAPVHACAPGFFLLWCDDAASAANRCF